MPQLSRWGVRVLAVFASCGLAIASFGWQPAIAGAASLATSDPSTHLAADTAKFQHFPPGRPAPRAPGLPADASPQTAARAFLAGPLSRVGPSDSRTALELTSVQPSAAGGTVVRFAEKVGGVPVFGAEVLVDLDKSGAVRSAASESLPGPAPVLHASINPTEASATALAVAAASTHTDRAALATSPMQQWIYDPRILGRPGSSGATLVWGTEVVSTSGPSVNRLIFVDANDGSLTLELDQIESARDRRICDAAYSARQVPCVTPIRTEGSPASSVPDVDLAYDYSGDTYDFFFLRVGRDSLDNQGEPLISTVRYCEEDTCPFDNAYWDGSQMVYGAGFAVDDVVGHELTHGVTTHMSDLIYDGQSGAINESLSDTFGEFVDLTNSGGIDTPEVRWKLGEDIPGIGVIRDMANPPAFGDPDRMGSPLYYNGVGDNGGVHTNSGVGNKLTSLLTDGGTFNGQTLTGVGLAKAAPIIYWAANLLTSSSDYRAFGQALRASCDSLIGTDGITAADCAQVAKAGLAVEIIPPLTAPLTPTAPAVLPGDGAASVAWIAPADGSSAITDYLVQYSSDDGASWASHPDDVSTQTAATVTGLTNGVGYLFRVAAVNAIGTGEFSPASATVTPGTPMPSTYSAKYQGPPVAVPDNSSTGVLTEIAVPSGIGPITKVTATLGRIESTYDQDLRISLISPTGTEVALSDRNGGSGDNYVGTVFDDAGVEPITTGQAPFSGTFRPQGSLATLKGENPTGNWRLKVVDAANGDTAMVIAWSVSISGPQPQTITFTPPTDTALSAGSVRLSAVATSGLPVTFTTATPAICTVVDDRASLVSPGTCSVNAAQVGNAEWTAAPEVSASFRVDAAGPLTFSSGAFPVTKVGTTSRLAVTVTNTGAMAAAPSAITTAGSGVGVAGGTCANGVPIPSAGSCSVVLSWLPTRSGTLTGASMTLAYSEGEHLSDQTALTGNAIGPPAPPVSSRLTGFPAKRQATVAWTAPTSNGGAPVSGYRLRVSAPNSATVFTPWVATSATSRILTGLTNGANYRVQVAAVTAGGVSQSLTLAFRQATTTSPVRDLRAAATPVAGRTTIAWNPPASQGGTPVVRYLIRVTAANSATYGPWVTSATTTRTLVSLRKGAVYRVQVVAVNTQGNSTAVTIGFRQAR